MDPKDLPGGGPAFPTDSAAQVGSQTWHFEGMTMRDYFAAKAMAMKFGAVGSSMTKEQLAIECFAMADAMLAAR